MKASAIKVNNQWRDVHKQPITDTGKHSKKGRLAVIKTEQGIETIREDDLSAISDSMLRPVFRNGELLIDDSFALIRTRAQ